MTIYPDPKRENHFLGKLALKSDFENNLNIVNDYNSFWVVSGNKLGKSHDWVGRFYNNFYKKDIFTYETLFAENIESYRRLAFPWKEI